MRKGFLFWILLFFARFLFGQISVTIITPQNLVGTSYVTVKAQVTPGEYDITSVIATIENNSVSFINMGPYFQGNLSASGLTIGNVYVLTDPATDVMANQGIATKKVLVDPPPKLIIQFPVNHEAATPRLHLKATANDNSDCRIVVSFQLYLNSGGSPNRIEDALTVPGSYNFYNHQLCG